MLETSQGALDAIRKAITTGASSITYDGKSTRFRSLAEMLALESRMANALAGTTATGANVTTFSKGLK